jgi:uncharacterized protein (DUF362 family)
MARKNWTRREFMATTGTAGASLLLGSTLLNCTGTPPNPAAGGASGVGGSGSGGTGNPGSGGSTAAGGSSAEGGSGSTFTGGALVSLVRDPNKNTESAVRDAVSLVGGFPDLTSKTVLLKPNLNSGDPIPYSTGPEVISAVIKMVSEKGAKRIIVGDRSNPSFDTLTAMQKSGITAIVDALKAQGVPVEAMNLNNQTTVTLKPSGASHWSNGFNTYKLLTDGTVDYVINCCVCKNHTLANYSMAMKAWMGIIVQNDRSTAHNDLGNRLPELHLGVKEDFVIMDATKLCLTNGPAPTGSNVVVNDSNIVVASKDAVANDIAGLCILKHYLATTKTTNSQLSSSLWSQAQIVRALALGNGWISNKSQFNYESKGISEIATMMQYLAG